MDSRDAPNLDILVLQAPDARDAFAPVDVAALDQQMPWRDGSSYDPANEHKFADLKHSNHDPRETDDRAPAWSHCNAAGGHYDH
jgi:hypothetical protein